MELKLEDFVNKNDLILYGRNNGISLRQKMNLNHLEDKYENIKIVIPENICSINSSFFIGLFKEFIKNNSISKFETKYTFICSKEILMNINDGISSLNLEK